MYSSKNDLVFKESCGILFYFQWCIKTTEFIEGVPNEVYLQSKITVRGH